MDKPSDMSRGDVRLPPSPEAPAYGAADGALEWTKFVVLLPVWVALTWAATKFAGWEASAVVLMLGVGGYWLLLPKAPRGRPLPGWTLLPLAVAFVAGIFVAGLMGEADEDLTAAGYGVWFVSWLQLGLWLRDAR